jgi:glycosyltransferase involved in cell wall biosynthesis
MNKIALLIPAYKPSPVLIELLEKIQTLIAGSPINKVIVVNDGSGQEFDKVFDVIKKMDGVELIEHAINLGKGAALKTGYNHILVKNPDISAIATADADGQHSPEDIVKLANASLESPESLYLGVREFDKDVPLRSRFGNIMTRNVLKVLTGLTLRDTQTGLRVIPKHLCLSGLKIPVNGYSFEMESIVSAGNSEGNHLNIVEVPIQTIYEEGNPTSHFNPVLDSMRIYFVFIRYLSSSLFASLIDNSTFAIVYGLTSSPGWAQFWGRLISLLAAFFILKNAVFKSNARWYLSLAKYSLLVGAFGLISYAVINFTHQNFGTPIVVSKILVESILFITGFAFARSFIFKSKKAE